MADAPHIPVLLSPVLDALAPLEGAVVIDGTFGAGGYTRAILAAGAARVIGIDRDPRALALGRAMATEEPRLTLIEAGFDRLDAVAEEAGVVPDAVVLDIGVSSMQLDEADRGFSFMRDGPLDMRMADDGPTAADIVNTAEAEELADILHHFGEERAARRIARAIVAARAEAPIETTLALAEVVAGCLPRAKPGQIHPATRSFQGLRIAVNDELGQLVRALAAAEQVLGVGGRLVVVSFHSLEDRIVKRFFQTGAGQGAGGSRHLPAAEPEPARWARPAKPVAASEAEIAANPRARSARLRAGCRTAAPARTVDARALGQPIAPVAADFERRALRRASSRHRRGSGSAMGTGEGGGAA
ncbi:MAG: 16S rRNA (cytosine(1402)-N(4))-methyltransferase RsmH [Pseudomonadota bacterium]